MYPELTVVLDLDETLVSVSTHKTRIPADFTFTLDKFTYYAKKRPHLDKFLTYVFKYCRVGVWTAATRDYAVAVINNIMTYDQQSKLLFVVSRDSMLSLKGAKPLARLFPNLKWTVMLEDRLESVSYNKGNGLIVPAWRGQPVDNALIRAKIVISWLRKNLNRLDLRTFTRPLFLNEITL